MDNPHRNLPCGETFRDHNIGSRKTNGMIHTVCLEHGESILKRTVEKDLSYSRVKGDSRLNDAKMAELKDRVSM